MSSESELSPPSSPPGSQPISPAGSPYLRSAATFSNSKIPHLTPLSSRDDDYAISSDSDIASLGSSEFSVRSPSKRNRLESDTSTEAASYREWSLSPRTPKNKKDASGNSNSGNPPSSRSRSRGKRRLSKNKEELPPAANIFKNLLILEESLRQQVAAQRSLRHNYMLFLAVLSSFLVLSVHNLYFSVSEPEGYARVIYQFISLIIVVTLSLYYLSGEYHRTIVAPRKFLSTTNKGLRQLNVRLTKVRIPLTERLTDAIRYSAHLVAVSAQVALKGTGPIAKLKLAAKLQHLIAAFDNRAQPRVGATEVKLVLNPRVFSTNTRENWEMYRNEFWAREGARRRGAKVGVQPEDNDRRELIDRDKRERKERRKFKQLT